MRSVAWRQWLAEFPSYPERERSALMRYQKDVLDHLSIVPDVGELRPHEARRIAEDLVFYCQELQAQQEADAGVGLINLGVALFGFAGAIFFPAAAVVLAALPAAAAVLACAQAYEQRRRTKIVDAILRQLRDLSRRLR
ncbi:hypothetical protein FPZ54_11025 [Sphingomonas suaedae]|uniref:DUF2335 domain-containing protein n=1 Tax=Sphingomonas suaedae TaxID=2599297 RepID=A0A518RGC5_9SPHN|nr:hypothetical protein FPZ54_11025 [Sphingomonas suaedae]